MQVASRRILENSFRACKRASVEQWHPNQLRHTAATRIRAAFGLDAAQKILGHERADVSQVYADVAISVAIDVARASG